MKRNLSMNRYFTAVSAEHKPKYRFDGKTRAHWLRWHKALLPAVKASLGRMPAKVPINAEVQAQWQEDGLNKQRIIFDVEKHLSAVAYLFWPSNVSGKVPAILACHGHGNYGKDAVMGNRSSPDIAADIADHNYDYGLQMAKAGYAVIAIDWRGFGERDDRRKPNFANNYFENDPCSANLLRATLMGQTPLGMNVHDGMVALDYLCSRKFVDTENIGVMGLSYGGTMTTFMSIVDQRIKAADIICYSDRFADFAMRDNNACGVQVTPDLYSLCDVPDLQGLIAPRPLLVEIGTYDNCFMVDSAMSCFHEVEKIFLAAGKRDLLELDLFEGGHRWGANKSRAFFDRHLKG